MRAPVSICLVLLVGCGSGPEAVDAGPSLDCGLRLVVEVRGPGGEYGPIAGAALAELVQGFQGFRYIYVLGRLARRPAVVSGTAIVTLDGEAARSQPLGDLGIAGDGAGAFATDPLRVFFNDDPLPSIVDRGCTVTLRVGDEACGATSGGHVTLAYDPACYEGPDGERVCPDAAVSDAGDGDAGPADAERMDAGLADAAAGAP
jgi:hypothetical protein